MCVCNVFVSALKIRGVFYVAFWSFFLFLFLFCFSYEKIDLSKIIQKCQQSRQLHNNNNENENNENIVILITIDNNNKKDVSNSAIERLRGDD